MSTLSARLLIILGLGMLLVGLGGGFRIPALGVGGGVLVGFALGVAITASAVERRLRGGS